MDRIRFWFRLHRIIIVLICIALMMALMQNLNHISLRYQMIYSMQVEELENTLIHHVTEELLPLMAKSDGNGTTIKLVLDRLTHNSLVLDASVYNMTGSLIARSGENISVQDKLAIANQQTTSIFNNQLVHTIKDNKGLRGFVRITLDPRMLEIEAKQLDDNTNHLRLMLLIALTIGIILTRTLLQKQNIRQQ